MNLCNKCFSSSFNFLVVLVVLDVVVVSVVAVTKCGMLLTVVAVAIMFLTKL